MRPSCFRHSRCGKPTPRGVEEGAKPRGSCRTGSCSTECHCELVDLPVESLSAPHLRAGDVMARTMQTRKLRPIVLPRQRRRNLFRRVDSAGKTRPDAEEPPVQNEPNLAGAPSDAPLSFLQRDAG